MNPKANKPKKQTVTKWASLRVSEKLKANAVAKLKEINAKDSGRKVKFDEMFLLALEKLTAADVQMLRERSLTNSDRQEILRKKYSEIHGPISEEDFIGVTMTPAYFDFLKEHGHIVNAA